MAYFWIAQRAGGASMTTEQLAAAGLAQHFDDQALAEQWLTAFYPELVELGVDAVILMEEDRRVYGPMPLAAQ